MDYWKILNAVEHARQSRHETMIPIYLMATMIGFGIVLAMILRWM